MRTLLLIVVCGALCSACAGGTGVPLTQPRADTGFELTVLPESFAPGGSAEAITAEPQPLANGGVEVEIRAEASDLRAFYFELDYDASAWRPIAVQQNLGVDGQTIELAVTHQPGTVHAGRVLVDPYGSDGVSGELVLATVRFVPGAALPGRTVSDPPDRNSSAAILEINAGILSWRYASTGDYDQNSQVNIADLTPIGVNFNESTGGAGAFPYDTIESVVDGDSNGEINIADLTPIGANLQNTVAAYRVYRSTNEADYPASNLEPPKVTHIGEVPFSAATGAPNQERLSFTFDATAEGGLDPANRFWVRPVDGAGTAGTPSNMVAPPAPGNSAPNIASFVADANPVDSGADVNLTVTATDPDGDPLTYTYTSTAGTVDATGTNTTVFHAPQVGTPTNVTITVTVNDGQGHTPTRDLVISVNPLPVTEVHIAFSPAAEGGNGTTANAFGLLGGADYTFTATDQGGADITSAVTFEFVNDPPTPSGFPQGAFNGNVFSTNIVGSGTFHVIGTWHEGLPDEVSSNPDAPGEEMHFTIVFTLP